MVGAKIAVHSVNSTLVGLAELMGQSGQAVVLDVPGGRILVAEPTMVALVTELLGPSAKATNPYEQRRRKEFLRRAGRVVSRHYETGGNGLSIHSV